MNWKKVLSLILVFSIVSLYPISISFAEEKDEEQKSETEQNPDEIIKREDIPDKEDIPDPPKDESLIGDEEDLHEIEIETPSSVTGEKMDGAGTVVDFSTTGAKAFYTIVDNDNNTFYLIIDMDKPDNNVYFLSDINKEQLTSETNNPFSENSSEVIGEPEQEENEQASTSEKEDKQKEEIGSSNLGFLVAVVTVGLVVAFGYYFFVIKRRQNDNLSEDNEDDEEDGMLETYDDEDIYSEEQLTDDNTEDEQQIDSDSK